MRGPSGRVHVLMTYRAQFATVRSTYRGVSDPGADGVVEWDIGSLRDTDVNYQGATVPRSETTASCGQHEALVVRDLRQRVGGQFLDVGLLGDGTEIRCGGGVGVPRGPVVADRHRVAQRHALVLGGECLQVGDALDLGHAGVLLDELAIVDVGIAEPCGSTPHPR